MTFTSRSCLYASFWMRADKHRARFSLQRANCSVVVRQLEVVDGAACSETAVFSEQVHKGVMVSTKLPTLRDMIENTHVDPSSFEIAEEIGAGAFATG